MKVKASSRILAMMLVVVMLLGMLPMNAFAASVDYAEEADDYYKVISQKEWDLAPGIVESEIIINNAAGDRQQVMHVVEVDPENEYTRVIPSSKGMVPTPGSYGVQTMDKQAAYAEENGYGNVVAAMNISLSWYDSTYYDNHPELVGEPLGYLILDGVQYTNSQGKTSGAQTCLVINFDEKDGVARPADMPKTLIRSTSEPITGWEEQVIPANFGFLVKDGVMVNSKEEHTSEGASRSMLGIKADGTIVVVMNDGRQAPYSTGFNNYEMSEAMLKLGCVYAINGDGGGSSHFLSQRPGEELELHCSPSDGSPRATTHGVLVITTAPSTGEFVRAHVEAEHQYYTPGSSVQFTATGADLSGAAAEIPAEVTWQLSDASMGTISDDGLFTSNGTTGEVTAQLVYNDEVVGSAAINLVVPDAIAFSGAEAYTVPFGESVSFNVSASYGVFDVALKEDDYTITVADASIGTLVGNTYTAGENAGKSTVTVALNANPSISKSVPLTIGKGSDVIFSFEENTEGANMDNWVIKDHEGKYPPYADISVVTAENGMVHNGDSALAVHMPMHTRVNGAEGYAANSITWVGDPILLENATAIGMWVYVPEEATQTEIALNYVWYNDQGVQQRTTPDLCLNDDFNNAEYSGWHYLSVPISKSIAYIEDATSVQASQGYKRNFFLKFYVTNSGNAGDESSYMGDITYYIDDVTIDYSDAVADRVAPVFSATYGKDISVENDMTLTPGNTIAMTSGNLSFTALVSDNVAIDAASAKLFIDGAAVDASYKNGRITGADVSLSAGVHRVMYEIADTMGNVSKAVRYVSVPGTDFAVKVVPHDAEATVALTGSVYWLDIMAANAENVESVSMKLDLDTMHAWELEHITTAYGYSVETSYASVADVKDNVITVVLTNNGSEVSGDAVIASIPVRVWSYCGNEYGTVMTPAAAWASGVIPAVSVNVEVESGEVIYKDNSSKTFSAEKIHIDTEAYIHQYKMDKTYFANNTYHVHTEEQPVDQAASCMVAGYTGRVFCSVCNSVVEWGSSIPATGHIYTITDGMLKCACGKLYTGEYEGKTYIDGKLIPDGWVEESYYRDGVKLTGVQEIDGKYYNFGDNGICANKYPMSAEWWTNEKGESFYFNAGVPTTEYAMINGVPTFFEKNGVAFQGEIELNGDICVFEKGVFVESTTAEVLLAGRAGPDAFFVHYADGTMVLLGEGATYDFVSVGHTYLPELSWKNRPWGKNTDLSNGIKKIVIGNGITYIGDYLFYGCYNVAQVEFEEGSKLTTINRVAFNYLLKLKEITLPDSLQSIGNQAFGYNTQLTKVVMPQRINYIQYNAFVNSSKVVLDVAEGTYAESFAIKYDIPYTTRAFVEDVAAEGTFGDNLTWSFYESGRLVIDGSGAMPDFANRNEQPWAAYRDSIYSIEIGKDITYLGKYAFAYAYSVKSVTFEEGSKLEKIGPAAVYYLSGLTEITLPNTLKRIDNLGLAYNAKLAKVYMPQGINYIQYNAFNNSGKVVLDVAEGTYAESFAIKYNIPYTTRAFVEAVVAEGTFGNNLTWSFYESGKLVIGGSGAMPDFANRDQQPWAAYRDGIYSIEIGKDITCLGKYAFAYAYSVKSVVFEKGSKLEKIGAAAIFYLSGMTEIVLPDTLKRIENLGLGYNAKLTKVYMPQGINYIQYNAFNNSSKAVLDVAEGTYAKSFAVKYNIPHTTRAFVEAVTAQGTFGNNLTWSFYESGKLVIDGAGAMPDFANRDQQPWAAYRDGIYSIVIGKDITYLGKYAFAYAYSVRSVVFEEGSKLERIGPASIFYLSDLTELVLPNTVKRIDNLGLAYNAKLAKVYMPQGITYIQYNAFNNSVKANLNVVKGSYAEAFAVKNGIAYTAR